MEGLATAGRERAGSGGAGWGPVLVLGASGYIGRHLVMHLAGQGAEVVEGRRERCDLLDPEAVSAVVAGLPPEARVVHCAVIDRAVDPSYGAMLRNLEMTVNLAAALGEHPPAGLIFLSTVDVFGRRPPVPIVETTPVEPESAYAIAKHASERALVSSLSTRCPVVVLRLPGVYGGEDPPKCVPRILLETMLEGRAVTLHGGGRVRRDWLHIDDLVHLVEALVRQPRPGVVNVATGCALEVRRAVEILARGAGVEARLVEAPESPDAAGDLVIDTGRLRVLAPEVSVRPMAEALVAYAAGRAAARS